MKLTKLIFLFSLYMLVGLNFHVNAQRWSWAHGFYSASSVHVRDMTTDTQGNVYIIGYYEDSTMTFQGTVAPNPYFSGFVVKLDKDGNTLLIKTMYGPDCRKLVVDEDQNIYIHASCNYFIFANITYSGNHRYLLKLDSMGNEIWAKEIDNLIIWDMKLSPLNRITIAGSFNNYIYFNGQNYPCNGYSDMFICEMDTAGNDLWMNTYGSSLHDDITTFCYESDSCIIIAGRHKDTLLLGTITLPSEGLQYKSFAARIAIGGLFVDTLRTIPQNGYIEDCLIDKNQDLVLIGGCSDALFSMDQHTISNPYPTYGNNGFSSGMKFLAKIDQSASTEWLVKISGMQPLGWMRIDLTSGNDIVVGGSLRPFGIGYSQFLFVNDSVYQGTSTNYPFILKFNNAGEILSVNLVEASNGLDRIADMSVDNDDDVLIAFTTGNGTFNFGDISLNFEANTAYNGFVAKYDDCGLQNIHLNPGWNLISSYILPMNDSLEQVMKSVASDIYIMKDGGGMVYWPDYGLNTIGAWHSTEGYQLAMNNQNSLRIRGEYVDPTSMPLTIEQGWQLIAYLRNSAMLVDTIFSGNIQNIRMMKDETGQIFWPEWNIDQIGEMKPGKAYYLNAYNPFVLWYPDNY